MYLNDENLEYAFSGKDFTNIGEEDSSLFDFYNLSIFFKGICKSEDETGATSLVIKLDVSCMRSTEIWLCYSLLLNNAENFFDGFLQIKPMQEQEIEIWIEDYDVAYSDNRSARLHFILEDGRRRILGRCNSICVDYNIFSGRYQYQKIDKSNKRERGDSREIDIRVNKMARRQFFSSDWSYAYYYNTLPIVITNCTDRNRAFLIDRLEFDQKIPQKVIGINALTDAISIEEWGSRELNIVFPDDYFPDGAQLYFYFTDIATNNRYISAYTYNSVSQICNINYSFIFIHDTFHPSSSSGIRY